MRYIPLREDKTPAIKLDEGLAFDEVKHFDHVAALVEAPFVVLDFDAPSEAKIIKTMVNDLDVKCLMLETTRGVHLWFQSPEPVKNSVKTLSAIGLTYDVRSHGKKSLAIVKMNGEWRKWVKTVPVKELDEVPFWLQPVKRTGVTLAGMKDGDGRNQTLFNYILTLQRKGFSKEQVRETLALINEYVFANPLPADEMETIGRDESFLEDDEVALEACFTDEGKFIHNEFARLLIGDMNIVTVNHQSYVFDDTYYRNAERTIEQRMIELFPSISRYQRMEVLDYVKIMSHKSPRDIPNHEYTVTLENGRLDLNTGELTAFDPAVMDFVKVPVAYDEEMYNEDLDKMLDRVFALDPDSRLTFEEFVGYCLVKNCRYRKGMIFLGEGSNGKSTVLDLLKRFFGHENVASIELDKLNDKFKTAELENRLVNIGDDINYRRISDTGTLKKLFTGESFTVERKGERPFELRSHAKLIFSANQMPRLSDTTHGIYSRLLLLPFERQFSSSDPDFDPDIEDKISRPEALSYLLNLAVKGWRRLREQGRFTESTRAKGLLLEYQVDQSTVLTWAKEEELGAAELTAASTTEELFSQYQQWHSMMGLQYPVSMRAFHSDLEGHYGLIRVEVRSAETDWKRRSKFERKGMV